jgi:hypothetical protein
MREPWSSTQGRQQAGAVGRAISWPMGAGLPRPNRGPPATVSASIALARIDRRSHGRCDSHHADLGLRLPLVDLAAALTPG